MTQNAYNLGELNIVLAERSHLMRRLMRGVLKELGVQEVRDVSTAEAAYDHFQKSSPDVIFTDWSPGLDGLELIEETRNGEDTPNPYVPIIVVSAYTELHHVIRARDSGVNEYLAKPVSAKRIYSRICSLVDNERQFIRCGDFFGPDRRRRKIDHRGYERRAGAKNKSANRRKLYVPFDPPERRRSHPDYRPPERRQRTRLGVKVEDQKRVIKGINDLVPADGKDVTIPLVLPRDTFELLRDALLYQSISGISSTSKGDAGSQSERESSISDMVSRLVSENLSTLKENHPGPITKPTPSVEGKSAPSSVRTNVQVSKKNMELLRDAVLARVVKNAPSSQGAGNIKKDNQHHMSEIIAELVEQNRGTFEDQAAALLGSKIK